MTMGLVENAVQQQHLQQQQQQQQQSNALNLTRERPCRHNEWMCTDRRKGSARLRCIACGAKWKMVLEWFEKCPEFHAEPSKSCPRGADCPHPHIYARSRKGDAPSQQGKVQVRSDDVTFADSTSTPSTLPTPTAGPKVKGRTPEEHYDSSYEDTEQTAQSETGTASLADSSVLAGMDPSVAAVALQLEQQIRIEQQQKWQQQQQQLQMQLQLAAMAAAAQQQQRKTDNSEGDAPAPLAGMGMLPMLMQQAALADPLQLQLMQQLQTQQMLLLAQQQQQQQKQQQQQQQAKDEDGEPSVMDLLRRGMKKGSPTAAAAAQARPPTAVQPQAGTGNDVLARLATVASGTGGAPNWAASSVQGLHSADALESQLTQPAVPRSTLNADAPMFIPGGQTSADAEVEQVFAGMRPDTPESSLVVASPLAEPEEPAVAPAREDDSDSDSDSDDDELVLKEMLA